ncbi:DUF2848 domain-containing protein [Leucobacter sp. CSA1]|uniref:DUF2848 domain-containing protein n=1 Tax=Leucobacter chromiisoli TaxID=2796471 RepID=A0A934UW57_9MICO|nr:DUF2848 domain-containing protein [Leucobacter chromiisoli]MBK0419582.1 DUF2848 domain-containing protein [Leucobacter chromiisoli]
MSHHHSNPTLTFELPDGSVSTVTVERLLNAGYAGKNQEEVRAHIDELAELGVPAPATTPTLYPVSPYLAQQTDRVSVQHGRTSGEAEWALVIDDEGRELLTAACDHTDRQLETHGVAWSKNASPDVLARKAWLYSDVADRMDRVILSGWVGAERTPIQSAPAAALLEPSYWLDVLEQRGERRPGTVLISGTITMDGSVDQFADRWGVALEDPELGRIELEYDVVRMADPIH